MSAGLGVSAAPKHVCVHGVEGEVPAVQLPVRKGRELPCRAASAHPAMVPRSSLLDQELGLCELWLEPSTAQELRAHQGAERPVLPPPSLAGRGHVEGQCPGFVRGWSLLRCEHTWAKPTSGWPRWAFPYWPET